MYFWSQTMTSIAVNQGSRIEFSAVFRVTVLNTKCVHWRAISHRSWRHSSECHRGQNGLMWGAIWRLCFFSECFICEKSFHLSVLNQLNIDEFPVSSDWNTQLLPPYGSILCLILSKILSHHPRSRVIVPDSLSQKSV